LVAPTLSLEFEADQTVFAPGPDDGVMVSRMPVERGPRTSFDLTVTPRRSRVGGAWSDNARADMKVLINYTPRMQWLLAGRLLDGSLGPVRRDVALGLSDQHINAVRSLADWQPSPGERVSDHRDATVVPGLIDSHVHLVFDHGPDSAGIRQRVQSSDRVALGLLAARNAALCLGAGVTTVRDCGDRDLITLQVRDAVERGWLQGPRILAAGPPITRRGGHLEWCGHVADGPDQVRTVVASVCDSGVDWVKIVASGGNMTPGSEPFQPAYSLAELEAATLEAHRRGRRVAAHALNAEAIRRAIAAGVDSIEHCLWKGPDGRPAYDGVAARELVKRGIYVGVNMAGIDRVLLPIYTAERAILDARGRELRDRWDGARAMLALDARVMLSSDAGTRNTRFEDFSLSLLCGVEALNISPLEAIHRASLVAAQALGIDHEVGSVEVGKRADLVVVEGDPSVSIADMRRVREVWRDGRLVANCQGLARPESVPMVSETGHV
jgi:imidazolonepropionase-like amidohydrolase